MAKKFTLGKGLSALIPEETEENMKENSNLLISINKIKSDEEQPRKLFDSEKIAELAESIKTHGIIQPLILRKHMEDQYIIVAGERRWRAAKMAGLKEVPAVIMELTDRDILEVSLIENIQRQDLNPIDQALALQRFHDEFGLSHQEIADTVGKARTTVSNLLRLLSLADDIKEFMQQGQLDMGHARAILTLKGKEQLEVAKIVIEKGLSVRQTEQLVRDWNEPKQEKEKAPVAPDIEQLTQKLSERFGANVKIDHNQKGKGKLVIHYHSLDELDGILNICLPD